MAIIYKATNTLNGKSYIGYTSRPLNTRMIEHKYYAEKGHTKFYNAIKKYGWESFEWSVLLDDAMIEDEAAFVEKYQTIKEGYNLKGGGTIPTYSEESRKKMSASAKTKKITNQFREKCRNRMTGIKQSPELIAKRIRPKEYEVTFPCGRIEEVRNMSEFCRTYNLNPTHMSSTVNGNRPHHKGFIAKELQA